jgi:hypothetical protein
MNAILRGTQGSMCWRIFVLAVLLITSTACGDDTAGEVEERGAVQVATERLDCIDSDRSFAPNRPDLPFLGKCALRAMRDDLERDDQQLDIGYGAMQQCAPPSERYAGTEEELAQCLLDAGL